MRRFKSNPADGLHARMNRYEKLIQEIVPHLTDRPLIFLEGYSYSSKGSVIALGEFGALLRQTLLLVASDVIEVAPTTLKKFVTGKGNGGKEQVIAHAARRWRIIYDSNDEVDAYCLAKIGLAYVGAEKCETAQQREVIEMLKGGKVKVKKKAVRA